MPEQALHPSADAVLADYAAQDFWPAKDAQLRVRMRQSITRHGDAKHWETALANLPALNAASATAPPQSIEDGALSVLGELSMGTVSELESALRGLHPWRKGPWSLFGLEIDTEWRSDWKWRRLAANLPDLTGQRILDVGCGNGYYGWHMLRAGATEVVGIDPTVLFFYQHLAMARYFAPLHPNGKNQVLPLSLEDLNSTDNTPVGGKGQPDADAHGFDSVFSMGVLYHRRDTLAHLRELREQLRPGGTLVLETLVCQTHDLVPEGRYARMRNVHLVPRPATISRWLEQLGFRDCRACDITTTSLAEQRTTPWMTFESLRESLDPEQPELTIEGHPAPVRACFVAHWDG